MPCSVAQEAHSRHGLPCTLLSSGWQTALPGRPVPLQSLMLPAWLHPPHLQACLLPLFLPGGACQLLLFSIFLSLEAPFFPVGVDPLQAPCTSSFIPSSAASFAPLGSSESLLQQLLGRSLLSRSSLMRIAGIFPMGPQSSSSKVAQDRKQRVLGTPSERHQNNGGRRQDDLYKSLFNMVWHFLALTVNTIAATHGFKKSFFVLTALLIGQQPFLFTGLSTHPRILVLSQNEARKGRKSASLALILDHVSSEIMSIVTLSIQSC